MGGRGGGGEGQREKEKCSFNLRRTFRLEKVLSNIRKEKNF